MWAGSSSRSRNSRSSSSRAARRKRPNPLRRRPERRQRDGRRLREDDSTWVIDSDVIDGMEFRSQKLHEPASGSRHSSRTSKSAVAAHENSLRSLTAPMHRAGKVTAAGGSGSSRRDHRAKSAATSDSAGASFFRGGEADPSSTKSTLGGKRVTGDIEADGAEFLRLVRQKFAQEPISLSLFIDVLIGFQTGM